MYQCVCVCVRAAFCNIAYSATHLNSIKLQRQLHKTEAAKQAPHASNNVGQNEDDYTKDAACDDEVARFSSRVESRRGSSRERERERE